MLRIWTESEDERGGERRLQLRLEGQLRGAAVAELARVAEDAIARSTRAASRCSVRSGRDEWISRTARLSRPSS